MNIKAWKSAPEIRIEGPLLTFDCTKSDHERKLLCHDHHGARYGQHISPEFPYFEVSFDNSKHNYSLVGGF